MQQPLTVFLTQCNGISILEETIYENRFQNVKYLNNMGANIKINSVGNKITVKGIDPHNKKVTIKAEGFLARIFQHEIDHLEGHLFIEKARNLRLIADHPEEKEIV